MKRSVLSICFLSALTLSSLCLLSSRISPVYAEYPDSCVWWPTGTYLPATYSTQYLMNESWKDDNSWVYYMALIDSWTAQNENGNALYDFGSAQNTTFYVKWKGILTPGTITASGRVECKIYAGLTSVVPQMTLVKQHTLTSPIGGPSVTFDMETVSFSGNYRYIFIYFTTFGDFSGQVYITVPPTKLWVNGVWRGDLSTYVSLNIQGDPELNYDFLMNGSAYTTPYSNSLFVSGNSITLENSSPSLTVGHFIYTFSYWSINATDNLTSSTFTVDIGGNTTISLVFSKAIMDIVFDPRTIASETVHLADTGSQLGKMLGVNSFIGGLIMSAIICGIFLFPVMIFKRTLLPMAIMGFLGLAISTGLGFLPFWIDLVLLLIISILFSGKIRDAITGATN